MVFTVYFTSHHLKRGAHTSISLALAIIGDPKRLAIYIVAGETKKSTIIQYNGGVKTN